MTTDEKDLLLKDISGRLPYEVKIMFSSNGFRWDWEQTLEEITKCDDGEYSINGWGIHGIKPYLRPMSSMTEEEKYEFKSISNCKVYKDDFYNEYCEDSKGFTYIDKNTEIETFNWLNARHFDYRGLIEKGLAFEAPKKMYNS